MITSSVPSVFFNATGYTILGESLPALQYPLAVNGRSLLFYSNDIILTTLPNLGSWRLLQLSASNPIAAVAGQRSLYLLFRHKGPIFDNSTYNSSSPHLRTLYFYDDFRLGGLVET